MKIIKKISLITLIATFIFANISTSFAVSFEPTTLLGGNNNEIFFSAYGEDTKKTIIYRTTQDFTESFHLLTNGEAETFRNTYRYSAIPSLMASGVYSIDLKRLAFKENFTDDDKKHYEPLEIKDNHLYYPALNQQLIDVTPYIQENEKFYADAKKEKEADIQAGITNQDYSFEHAEEQNARNIAVYTKYLTLKSGKKLYINSILTSRIIPPPYTPEHYSICLVENNVSKTLTLDDHFSPHHIYENADGSFWLSGYVRLNKWVGYNAAYYIDTNGNTKKINDLFKNLDIIDKEGLYSARAQVEVLGAYNNKALINVYQDTPARDEHTESTLYELTQDFKLKKRKEKNSENDYNFSFNTWVSPNGQLFYLKDIHNPQDKALFNLTKGTSKSIADNSAGNVMFTDIKTFINNQFIPTINVDGHTGIAIKDLRNLAYDVTYDNETKTATITSPKKVDEVKKEQSNTENKADYTDFNVGQFIGSISKSDIKVVFDGVPFKAYNFEGHMIIIANECSKIGMNVDYNNDTRELRIAN